jgi:hypothetical protein
MTPIGRCASQLADEPVGVLAGRSAAGRGWHALILPWPSYQLNSTARPVRSTPKTFYFEFSELK